MIRIFAKQGTDIVFPRQAAFCGATQYCEFYTISIASPMLMLYKILPIGNVAQTKRNI